jgi:hypothetical protein
LATKIYDLFSSKFSLPETFTLRPTPKSVLGFHPTTTKPSPIGRKSPDHELFSKLDAASDRVAVREIGKTTLGKPFIVAFISARKTSKISKNTAQINQKLADPRKIKDDAELENLIGQGKTSSPFPARFTRRKSSLRKCL